MQKRSEPTVSTKWRGRHVYERMKKIVENRRLKSAADEFLAFKRAQKIRERTMSDYKRHIDKFLAQLQNTLMSMY